jgi:hypothetical protein
MGIPVGKGDTERLLTVNKRKARLCVPISRRGSVSPFQRNNRVGGALTFSMIWNKRKGALKKG